MPYAVFKQKGAVPGLSKYCVQGLPELKADIAVYITEEQERIAKHLIGVVTFKDVERIEEAVKKFNEEHTFVLVKENKTKQ